MEGQGLLIESHGLFLGEGTVTYYLLVLCGEACWIDVVKLALGKGSVGDGFFLVGATDYCRGIIRVCNRQTMAHNGAGHAV